ncbi:hypothetical protein [Pseudomonas plecoglossicida]|uniref:hypothetical protein n=1 Tax=Pseudomonas plecoglossicida TaxID=70775 RepID=UPI00048F698E|nr:hypothetical protein [Pseudomonas plecoglossicida]GLR36166.1 hypothetical protein GCM10011247_15630 [Pseudomonas plecoglossicida]
MNTLNECQTAIQAAQKRVDELLDARKFLDSEQELARVALRNAHAALQRLKSADNRLRTNAQSAELDHLRAQLDAVRRSTAS